MRKFIAEWGYGRPSGYFAEVELDKEELLDLEKAIALKEISGGKFYSNIKTIQLDNGMKLYAEDSPEYKRADEKRKNRNIKWRG